MSISLEYLYTYIFIDNFAKKNKFLKASRGVKTNKKFENVAKFRN